MVWINPCVVNFWLIVTKHLPCYMRYLRPFMCISYFQFLSLFFFFSFSATLRNRYCCTHFSVEDSKVQKVEIINSGIHTNKWESWNSKSLLPSPKATILTTALYNLNFSARKSLPLSFHQREISSPFWLDGQEAHAQI